MNLPPVLKQYWTDADGAPLAGGKIYTYQAGTTTPQATYTDQAGGTPNANPVVLDASGWAPMWVDPELSYKFVIKDSNDVELHTVDNVIGLLTVDAINTASIQDDAVTTDKIADDAVTADKLRDDASTDVNRAVTTNHIRDSAVTTAKINSEAVTRTKLATGAVAKMSVVSKTTTYTATSDDDVIFCSSSGAAFTVTLPAASGIGGKVLTLKKIDSSFNAVTIDGNGAETIDGSATTTLSTQHETLMLICDGSNWQVIERTYPMSEQAATLSGTWNTNVSYTGFWSRLGDKMKIRFQIVLSGAPNSAGCGITIPNSLTIDTGKAISTTGQEAYYGVCRILDSGTGYIRAGTISYNSSTSVLLQAYLPGGSAGLYDQLVSETSPMIFAAGDKIWGEFTVPIGGWSG